MCLRYLKETIGSKGCHVMGEQKNVNRELMYKQVIEGFESLIRILVFPQNKMKAVPVVGLFL